MAKQQKKKSLHDETVAELKAQLVNIDRDLFALRNELATNRKLEKPHLLIQRRKEKARVLTVITQKEKKSP